MIRVHYSNRLENLIAPLADAISAQQRLAPLTRIPIVVPGRAMEHYLKHRLSEAIGVAANLDFPFLRIFLQRIAQATDPKLRILDVEELELVLFEILRRAVRENAPGLEAPCSYIETGGDNEREVRAFHLAGQIARLFREYSITRQSMLHRWRNSSRADGESSDAELWQRNLYRSIFDVNGYLRNEWKNDAELDWMLLPDAVEKTAALSSKLDLRGALHIFGLAYAGPAYARIFARLGELTEINIYALNLCLEYWEDVDPLSGLERVAWAHHHQKIGTAIEDAEDPFALEVAGDTPALRLWGRPGREYIRLLNELTDCDFDAHFTHHHLNATTSLLHHVQESILNREPERSPKLDNEGLADDGSIRFLACPGIAREVEIVANEIWSMLDRDAAGSDPIRFHEIAVVAPDSSYHDYLPHIEAAFSRSHQLPINVVNRAASSASPIREAISMLLRLPLGRFSRDEMLHLLEHPAIRGNDPETGYEQWNTRCEALGVFFGADPEDLKDTYIPRDIYHWDQALRRLALGVFMGTEDDHQPRFYRSSDGAEYLPYETSHDELDGIATFIKTARALLLDAIEIRSRRLTLTEWSQLLGDLILTHIHTSDTADERTRERCVLAIESIARLDLRSEPLSYPVAYETVSARLSEQESQLGQLAENGILVGPLSVLRALPFKVIFILGLDESRFPEQIRRDPMDLRNLKRRAGDVSPAERDRYLFLETLLAARERLFLCYIARDFKTGDQLEPSSIVRELQYILRGYVSPDTLKQLTIAHPLSRYDFAYFPDLDPTNRIASPLVSYDPEARRAARMAALRQDLKRHCGDVPLPGRDDSVLEQLANQAQDKMRSALRMLELRKSSQSGEHLAADISLPISALRKFLECPLQGAAQYALGIFEDESEDFEDYQDEPVAQSLLDRTMLLREAFWKAHGDPARLAVEHSKAFKVAQMRGAAPAGPFADAAKSADLINLVTWMEQAKLAGCGDLSEWREIQLSRAAESTSVERVTDELFLEVPVPDKEGKTIRVKINGGAGFLSPSRDASIRLVLRGDAKTKDFLGPLISAIVLVAAEQINAPSFRSVVLCSKGKDFRYRTKTLKSPAPQAARDYLTHLVSNLLFDKNHYFLPIEAVDAAFKEIDTGGGDDLADLIDENIRDNDFVSCSSDFGPIRDARRFEPPNSETIKRILQQRFGILKTIFRNSES